MVWLALCSGEFFKAFALDAHFGLGMEASIIKYAERIMNEEALHVLAAYNQSIHIETIDTLKTLLNLRPLDTEYNIHLPDDPVLSRAAPIRIPIMHDGIPIDENLKESFSRLLEQAFFKNTSFVFNDLPKEFQEIVNDFHAKHISDLSGITN